MGILCALYPEDPNNELTTTRLFANDEESPLIPSSECKVKVLYMQAVY